MCVRTGNRYRPTIALQQVEKNIVSGTEGRILRFRSLELVYIQSPKSLLVLKIVRIPYSLMLFVCFNTGDYLFRHVLTTETKTTTWILVSPVTSPSFRPTLQSFRSCLPFDTNRERRRSEVLHSLNIILVHGKRVSTCEWVRLESLRSPPKGRP